MAIHQPDIPQLKILSFGAGAIGTYIGGSLALAGQGLVFVERPEVVDELRERGLRLDLSDDRRRKAKGAYLVDPSMFVAAGSLEDALKYGPFDVAIFALKSFDTPTALEGIKPFASKMPPVLCLSNGVDNERLLAGVLGEEKVIYGTVTTAIGRRGLGDIVLEKLRGIGIASTHPISKSLISAAKSAFLNPRPFSDPAAMKWSKMMTNLIANPASAILDMTAAEIFAHKDLYAMEIAMLRECLSVMDAQGIRVMDLPGTPVSALAFATGLPLWLSKPLLSKAAGGGRGGKMPSFHIDLHSGRGKSEVGYLHGAVVRTGEKLGLPTPVNKLLTETLQALTDGEMALETYAHQPEKFLAQLEAAA